MDKSQGDYDITIKLTIDRVVPDQGTVYSEGLIGIADYWLGEGAQVFMSTEDLRRVLIAQATAVIDMALAYIEGDDDGDDQDQR